MTEKSIVYCKDCAKAVCDLGVGFTADTILVCSERDMPVEYDDCCTFGIVGEHGYVAREYEIDLCGDAVVGSVTDELD